MASWGVGHPGCGAVRQEKACLPHQAAAHRARYNLRSNLGVIIALITTCICRCERMVSNEMFKGQCLGADVQFYLEQCKVDICYEMDLQSEYPTECQVINLLVMVIRYQLYEI